MSVMPFHKPELEDIAASLHNHLMKADYQTWGGYEKADTYRTISIAGIANSTAATLTYGGDDDWDDTRNLQEIEGTLTAKETYIRLDSLLYNCVSNDGTDCIPKEYKEILQDMQKCIIEHAAGWTR